MSSRLWFSAFVLLALSCGATKGLVLLDVTSTVRFDDVRLTVRANDAIEVSYENVSLDEQTPLKLGLYLPADVHGTVTLTGEVHEGDCVRGRGTRTATGIVSGKTSEAFGLVIEPGAADSCSSGAGGGGEGGAVSGAAGSEAPGGRGSEPETGGAGGAPGEGGSSGVAGDPGGGGGSAGASGTGGAVGSAGAGGRGGRGGAAGLGGRAGGAGLAGRGGSGGRAGTPGGGGSAGVAGGPASPPPTGLQIVAQCQTDTPNTIAVRFKILNFSSASIPLSSVTARYLYTLNDATLPVVEFDYLQSLPLTSVTTMVTTSYVDFGFTAAAGTLQAFDTTVGTGEIQLRIHPPNYMPTGWNLSQADDPSFKACTGGSYEPRPSIIGYVGGDQSWPPE
jgi:hypothetical protein